MLHLLRLTALTLALLATALPAMAQGWSGPQRRDRNDPGEPLRFNPTPQNSRDAWPRLDPGAAFCSSIQELEQRQAAAAAAARGGQVVADADCAIVRAPTPVTVLERRGPGRTRVRLANGTRTGWTDAWLPERGPGGTATETVAEPATRNNRR